MRGLAMACTINRHQLRKEMHRTAADYWPMSFFMSGETLIAISIYEFLLRFLPEIIQAVAALL